MSVRVKSKVNSVKSDYAILARVRMCTCSGKASGF